MRFLRAPLLLGLGLLLSVTSGAAAYGVYAFRTFRPAAITIGQKVFYFSDKDPVMLRVHEEYHRTQYRKIGTARFLYHYLSDSDFRFRMEADAIVAESCLLERGDGPEAAYERLDSRGRRKLRRYDREGTLSDSGALAYAERAWAKGARCDGMLARLGFRPLEPSIRIARQIARYFVRGPESGIVVEEHPLARAFVLPADSALSREEASRAMRGLLTRAAVATPFDAWEMAESERWSLLLSQDSSAALRERAAASDSAMQELSLVARARALSPYAFWDSIPAGARAPDLPLPDSVVLTGRIREALEHAALALAESRFADAERIGQELVSFGGLLRGEAPSAPTAAFAGHLEVAGLVVLGRTFNATADTARADEVRRATAERQRLEPAPLLPNASPGATALALARIAANPVLPRSVRWNAYQQAHALEVCGGVRAPGLHSAEQSLDFYRVALVRGPGDEALRTAVARWPGKPWECTLYLSYLERASRE